MNCTIYECKQMYHRTYDVTSPDHIKKQILEIPITHQCRHHLPTASVRDPPILDRITRSEHVAKAVPT